MKKPPETSRVVSFVIDYDCGIVIDAQPAGKFLEAFTVRCHAGLAGVGLARGMEGAGNVLNQPGDLLYRSQYHRFSALSVQHRINLGRGNQGMPAREALVLLGLQRAAQDQENERQQETWGQVAQCTHKPDLWQFPGNSLCVHCVT